MSDIRMKDEVGRMKEERGKGSFRRGTHAFKRKVDLNDERPCFIHPSSFILPPSSFRLHPSSSRRAFTLIEILVVVTILAMLASAIVLSFSVETDWARVARAKSDIATLENAIDRFRLSMRRYPAEEEGLAVLVKRPDSEDATRWEGPYIKRLEKDPWGNPYVYVVPGDHNTESYDLICYGLDGQEGGPGEYDKDIGNWAQEEQTE